MANSNRVHQIANMHNDKTREQYEITDNDARERLDAVEANMTSALAQISAAEGRINSAVQTQNGQIGALDGRTEALEDGVEAINEVLQENVTTVNGQTGNVMLTATDVGALPDDTLIPQYLSELHPDGDHLTVTSAEKSEWYDKVSQEELSYVANRIDRVINQSGEPNVIDRILVNGVEAVPDGRTVSVPDTTYTVGVSGHTLTMTDNAGNAQTAALPNDSYDDAALRGRMTEAERDILSLQATVDNMELTADNVTYGDSDVETALDSLAEADTAMQQTIQGVPAMQTLLNNTVSNEAEYVVTSATASRAYAAGDYIVLNGILYKVTSSISSGETIGSSNTQRVYITDEITTIAGDLAEEAAAARADMEDDIEALQQRLGAGLSFGVSGGKYGYFVNGSFSSFRAPTGNAVAGDVLSGKTFANAASDSETGTMPNNGAVSQALNCGASYTVPAGYHNGSGTVTANSLASQTGVDDGKTAATAASMRSGYQAWVNGSKVSGSMATLTSSNFSGTHSSTTAGASSNYVTKSTSAGYVANNTSVNTLAAATSATIATTGATGTKTINIKPGYYNKISVNQTAAYEAGQSSAKLIWSHAGRGDNIQDDTGNNVTPKYRDSAQVTATKAQTVTVYWTRRGWNYETDANKIVLYVAGTAKNVSVTTAQGAGYNVGSTNISVASGQTVKLRCYGQDGTNGVDLHCAACCVVY